ncbi:MAG: response regulator [Vicinamibacterales bacterium]
MLHSRILLVDDYADALEMWAFYLRTRGYNVLSAADGVTAVDIARDWLPHLVVMDLTLPGISGCEAARRLRGHVATAAIPIVATTCDIRPDHLDEARSIGFARIMIKPCDPPRLLHEIQIALSARATVDRFDRTAVPVPLSRLT